MTGKWNASAKDFRHRDCRSWDTCLLFGSVHGATGADLRAHENPEGNPGGPGRIFPRQRRRFLLHFAYGYTYLEIAKMEGRNKSTVMRSARAALKKIKKVGGLIATFARFLSLMVKGKNPFCNSVL